MKNNHKTLNRRVFTVLLAILSLLATQNVTATHAEIGGNDPIKEQMLAFMASYPPTGTSNYIIFINRLNKLLKDKSTTEIKTLSKTVQGDINYRYTAPGVTDAERANIKAIAKQLNNTYGWNLLMPTTPEKPDPDARIYTYVGKTKAEWDKYTPAQKARLTRMVESNLRAEAELKTKIAELEKIDNRIAEQEQELQQLRAKLNALQNK